MIGLLFVKIFFVKKVMLIIEIGTIDSYMDDKELTSKNLGINECEDVFGLSRKNDLKNVSYFDQTRASRSRFKSLELR